MSIAAERRDKKIKDRRGSAGQILVFSAKPGCDGCIHYSEGDTGKHPGFRCDRRLLCPGRKRAGQAVLSKMESDFHATRYKLAWADEFNEDGRPDPKRWTYETGFVRNNELRWYQPENAYCKDGLLIIEARRERKANPDCQAGGADWKKNRAEAQYTSASLATRGIANWKYGRFEMRGRFDGHAGLWPEFWMMGDRQWPWNGEIDILESWQGMLNANVIWAGRTPGYSRASSKRRHIASFGDPEWTSKFHVWRMDWDENRIEIYADDILLSEVDVTKAVNGDGSNGFRDPHSMLLNLAVGGTAGGDPSVTEFPARFEVDWVRVYQ